MPRRSPWGTVSAGKTPQVALGQNSHSQSGQENAPARAEWRQEAFQEITDLPDDALATEFVGTRRRLFWLSLKTGFFTIFTLGLYRFWMKTRLRRWYWSAIRPGGMPLEYMGDPWEKLLGFLIAVVIMAFYIGIVNLLLMFASFSLLSNNFAAYLVSFLGVVPIWFYAQYRARRYVLARTRWRGVRFGLEKGAWGYTWRALMYWALTICTAGILWPLMTFRLEKYITDRTFFGSVRLQQTGQWQMLFPATKHMYIALGQAILVAGLTQISMAWLGFAIVPSIWVLYGMAYYWVNCRKILANHKRAGDAWLVSMARTPRVVGILLLGYFLAVLLAIIPLLALGFAVGFYLASTGDLDALDALMEGGLSDLPSWLTTMFGLMAYFAVFLLWATLRHIFVTMPVWKHFAETLVIMKAGAFAEVSQRARDEMAEAEGFAEALDLGAAI